MTLPSVQRPALLFPVLLILSLAGVISFRDIGRAPIYFGGDEAQFGVHAYAIAATGRDLDGRFLPLLVNLTDPQGDPGSPASRRWYQPTLFYLLAIVLRFLPLNEVSVRMPVAFIGVLDALLVLAVARRLFSGWWLPTLAALILVCSPAHVILSRQAADYICPLPFVLGWMWCLLASIETGSVWLSLAAGLLLGVGFYSYLAAWVLMPTCLLLTWLAQHQSGRHAGGMSWTRLAAAAAIGFIVPVLPLVPWLWSHHQMLRDTLGRYGVSAVDHVNFSKVQEKVSVYWDYFNPGFLFLTGGRSLTTTTGTTGAFLAPLAIFLPAGVYALVKRHGVTAPGILLLGGLAAAPIPAALAGERDMIQRALVIVPLCALIGTFGIALLLEQPRRTIRVLTVLLLAAMPLQFAFFQVKYFGPYRDRSSEFFDPSNFRDLADYLVSADAMARVPAVYLSRILDDGSPRWRFYLTKLHREELLQRTLYFDGDGLDMGDAAPGSLMAIYSDEHKLAALLETGKWSTVRAITNVGGDVASVVLKRVR